MSDVEVIEDPQPIHGYFGLSYANYLTIPRSVLQSMPVEWQRKFVRLLEEMSEAFGDIMDQGKYDVRLRGADGRFVEDVLADYQRGRRRLEPKT